MNNWKQYINKVNCMDALDLLKMIPDKSIDLVLTDPPYGINADKGVGGFGSSQHTAKKYKGDWDCLTPDKKVFDELLRVGISVIIFGGNFFTDRLPVNGHWIVWDKVGEIKFDNPFSKAELCWTNIDKKSVNKYVIIQQGFVSKEKDIYHPTQKPVELISNIIRDYSDDTDLILDPFMGSWTTAVACQNLKRNFIGCELDKDYCEIGRQRLRQQTLF